MRGRWGGGGDRKSRDRKEGGDREKRYREIGVGEREGGRESREGI